MDKSSSRLGCDLQTARDVVQKCKEVYFTFASHVDTEVCLLMYVFLKSNLLLFTSSVHQFKSIKSLFGSESLIFL